MIFSSNKKIHWLHIKCYFVTRNSFVAEVTFKLKKTFQNKKITCLIKYVLLIRFFQISIVQWYDRTFVTFKAFRSSHSQMFYKIGVFENFAKFTGNHLCWSPFLLRLHAKETPLQVFLYDFCETFKNTLIIKHLMQ